MILPDNANSILNQANELQYNQIESLPEDIDALIRRIQEVREAYLVSVQTTGLGREHFVAITDELLSRLKEASRLVGSVKL